MRSHYNICSLFEIEKAIEISSLTINQALDHAGYSYVDWFKTDTQGTDFRIFLSINELIRNKILVLDFEPGILNAYKGEDKLYKIMEYFDDKDYWCNQCLVKGMIRLNEKYLRTDLNFIERRYLPIFISSAGFLAEISYVNEMKSDIFSERDYFLMSVFGILKKQYGFVREICETGKNRFKNDFFDRIRKFAIYKMRINGYKKLPFLLIKNLCKKFTSLNA